MAAIFGPGGTDYSAVHSPGGLLFSGDCPRRDSPCATYSPPQSGLGVRSSPMCPDSLLQLQTNEETCLFICLQWRAVFRH